MFLCTVTCFTVQWHVSLHMTCSLQLLPNVHQCTVKHVTVHWCLLPNVHQCTVKQVTVHWCLLPNVHQCTVKHVAVHWCTFGNSCKLHDVGWTACFFMYLRRCLLYVLASTLLQSQEGSFCLFIWNVVRFCVSVWERERACVCVCVPWWEAVWCLPLVWNFSSVLWFHFSTWPPCYSVQSSSFPFLRRLPILLLAQLFRLLSWNVWLFLLKGSPLLEQLHDD